MEEYETVEETEVDSVDEDEVESEDEVEEEIVEVDADDGRIDWWGGNEAEPLAKW